MAHPRWAAVVLWLVGAKAWSVSPAARRAYGSVWLAGTVLSVSVIVVISAAQGVFRYRDAYGLLLEIVAGIAPVTLAASLFITRVAQERLVALVADLETVGPGSTLRSALRRALADPSLDVVYLRAGSEHVTVRSAIVDGGLWLAVTDDGCGDAAAAPGSGLEGLADRVGALGGQLLIEATLGAVPASSPTSRSGSPTPPSSTEGA